MRWRFLKYLLRAQQAKQPTTSCDLATTPPKAARQVTCYRVSLSKSNNNGRVPVGARVMNDAGLARAEGESRRNKTQSAMSGDDGVRQ